MTSTGGWRKNLLLSLLLGAGTIGTVLTLGRPTEEPLVLEAPTAVPSATAAATATPAPLVVYVSGAVRAPGVYTLPPGSRVVDALGAAGGPTSDAALESLNQATHLTDGMQVHMPEEGAAPVAPLALAPASAASDPGSALIPLNRADVVALDVLPGIGPALASRIVAYRDTHGPFTSIDQLLEVRGIGEATLAEIREHLVLD